MACNSSSHGKAVWRCEVEVMPVDAEIELQVPNINDVLA
jgi:hypothetical protein